MECYPDVGRAKLECYPDNFASPAGETSAIDDNGPALRVRNIEPAADGFAWLRALRASILASIARNGGAAG